jgi:hypothetical protein
VCAQVKNVDALLEHYKWEDIVKSVKAKYNDVPKEIEISLPATIPGPEPTKDGYNSGSDSISVNNSNRSTNSSNGSNANPRSRANSAASTGGGAAGGADEDEQQQQQQQQQQQSSGKGGKKKGRNAPPGASAKPR